MKKYLIITSTQTNIDNRNFYCVHPQMTHYRICIESAIREGQCEIYNFNPW